MSSTTAADSSDCVDGRLDGIEQRVEIFGVIGLVDDRQGRGVGAAAGRGEGERGGAVGEAELVGVVPEHLAGLEERREAVVHAPQPEGAQVDGLVVALGEEQHGGGGAEDHLPQAVADDQPGDAERFGVGGCGRRRLGRRSAVALDPGGGAGSCHVLAPFALGDGSSDVGACFSLCGHWVFADLLTLLTFALPCSVAVVPFYVYIYIYITL